MAGSLTKCFLFYRKIHVLILFSSFFPQCFSFLSNPIWGAVVLQTSPLYLGWVFARDQWCRRCGVAFVLWANLALQIATSTRLHLHLAATVFNVWINHARDNPLDFAKLLICWWTGEIMAKESYMSTMNISNTMPKSDYSSKIEWTYPFGNELVWSVVDSYYILSSSVVQIFYSVSGTAKVVQHYVHHTLSDCRSMHLGRTPILSPNH